jgi:hypothetical protein
VIATVPTPLEDVAVVAGLMASWVTLRAAWIGFVLLLAGATPRDIADAMGPALATGLPGALAIGLVAALYLVIEG